MKYKQFQNLSLEQRTKLSKKLLLKYFSKLLDLYEYKKVEEPILRKEAPYSKKDKELEGVCDNEARKIYLNQGVNNGFNQLRILLHEQIEAILGNKQTFRARIKYGGRVRHISHNRIDKLVENIINNHLKA